MSKPILTMLTLLFKHALAIAQYTSVDSLLPSSIKSWPNIAIALSHLDGFEFNEALCKLLRHWATTESGQDRNSQRPTKTSSHRAPTAPPSHHKHFQNNSFPLPSLIYICSIHLPRDYLIMIHLNAFFYLNTHLRVSWEWHKKVILIFWDHLWGL